MKQVVGSPVTIKTLKGKRLHIGYVPVKRKIMLYGILSFYRRWH